MDKDKLKKPKNHDNEKNIEEIIEESIECEKEGTLLDNIFYCTHHHLEKESDEYIEFIDNFLEDYNFYSQGAFKPRRAKFLALYKIVKNYEKNLLYEKD